MAQASFTVDVRGLRRTFAKFTGEEPRRLAEEVIQGKKVAAIMSQAIADNFEKEGPNWEPLKPSTIRQSVSKTIRKRLEPVKSGGKLTGYTVKGTDQPARRILQRTGVLKKSATTPGAPGHVFRSSGTTIEWGTNLHYAGIHNRGGVLKNPGSNNAFGIKGLKTKAHSITIPARPYLRLSDYWYAMLSAKVVSEYSKKLAAFIRGET